ncbi:MAG: hypothetical protein ACFFCW_40230, partial [Candidatus Hodarchaeota archaeon]
PVPQSKPIRVSAHKERGRYQFKLYDESKLVLDGFVEVGDQETEIGSKLQEPPPERVEDLKTLSELADVEVKGSTLWTRLRQSFEAAGIPWTGGKCFGCSETESALKLRHRVAGQGLTWTRWKGEPKFTDGRRRLATTIVAAAIDCANLHAVTAEDPEFVMQLLRDKKLWVTGTYGVRFLRVPPVDIGGDYRVAARYLGRDGRKLFTMSALLDREGTVYAIGETVAIIFDFQTGMMGT